MVSAVDHSIMEAILRIPTFLIGSQFSLQPCSASSTTGFPQSKMSPKILNAFKISFERENAVKRAVVVRLRSPYNYFLKN